MTAVAERLPGVGSFPGQPAAEHSAYWPADPSRSTLEELILGVWEDLAARARADCPVCSGVLVPEACLDCGAGLG